MNLRFEPTMGMSLCHACSMELRYLNSKLNNFMKDEIFFFVHFIIN